MNNNPIKAVLLVGGMGTRLRPVVGSLPKPLARVGKTPFLELLVRQLRQQRIHHLIMCTGYRGEQIERAFGNGQNRNILIEYSNEDHPLGTAGAIKRAEPYIGNSSEFLVLNGDSFCDVDFSHFLRFHREHKALATIAVRRVDNAGRYGTVELGSEGRITRFAEKLGANTPGLINAGVYIFNNIIFKHIPEGLVSLEHDVLPSLLDRDLYGFEQNGMFIDIGTPQDYRLAQAQSVRFHNAVLRVPACCVEEQ